jgi:hypothetical protein
VQKLGQGDHPPGEGQAEIEPPAAEQQGGMELLQRATQRPCTGLQPHTALTACRRPIGGRLNYAPQGCDSPLSAWTVPQLIHTFWGSPFGRVADYTTPTYPPPTHTYPQPEYNPGD